MVLHLTSALNKGDGPAVSCKGIESAARKMLRLGMNGGSVAQAISGTSRVVGTFVGVVAVATMVTGCGMSSMTSGIGGGVFGGGSASKSADKAVTHEQMLSAAKANSPIAVGGDVAGGCPRFAVWPRDHHVTVYEQGRIGDGLAVRHRGEITQTARECQIQGTRVTVKYGFSGRVLLGPKGQPGPIKLPVNIFVTDAKRARISNEQAVVDVTVTSDRPVGYFSAVRTLSFDVPVGSRPGEFEVFVGFDQATPGAG